MVLGLVVMCLVDGNCGVDDMGLNGLLVDNGLVSLVNMVVDVLALNNGSMRLSLRGLNAPGLVLELGSLTRQVFLHLGIVTVVELAVLCLANVVVVLLGENLLVVDRLNSVVVVVLVDLLVYGSVDLLMVLRANSLVLNSRVDALVNCGIVVSRLGHEAGDGLLCLVHFVIVCSGLKYVRL